MGGKCCKQFNFFQLEIKLQIKCTRNINHALSPLVYNSCTFPKDHQNISKSYSTAVSSMQHLCHWSMVSFPFRFNNLQPCVTIQIMVSWMVLNGAGSTILCMAAQLELKHRLPSWFSGGCWWLHCQLLQSIFIITIIIFDIYWLYGSPNWEGKKLYFGLQSKKFWKHWTVLLQESILFPRHLHETTGWNHLG